jgi:hypothetical protein
MLVCEDLLVIHATRLLASYFGESDANLFLQSAQVHC